MDTPRNSMEPPWNSMEAPWNSMELHGIPWTSMEFHGILWNSMEFHGIPWGYFTRVVRNRGDRSRHAQKVVELPVWKSKDLVIKLIYNQRSVIT